MTFNTIAVINGHDSSGHKLPTSSFQHTIEANGYTSATRWAAMLALPSLSGLFYMQRLDMEHASQQSAHAAAPQQLGSQACESLFSSWRSTTGQNTGSISCADVLNKANSALKIAELAARGSFKLPEARKAARKHKLHDVSEYTTTVSDEDMNMSIETRRILSYDLFGALGYIGLLKRHTTLQSAFQEPLDLTRPQSPVRGNSPNNPLDHDLP